MTLIKAVARPERLTARAQVRDASRSWCEIRNADSPDEAEMLIYDEIGGWWGNTPESVIDELRQVTAPNLRVRINSPGGSVFDGVAIANAIRLHPANVTVQIDGIAASIASVIAMAGDRVVMTPQSQMMIHDASGLCYGNAAEMEEMAELLDLQSDNVADAYAERAGGTREEWRARMQAETWYLAAEAVEAGLADEVLPARKQAEEPEPVLANSWDLSVFRYAGREQAPDPQPVAATPVLTASVAEGLSAETVAKLLALAESAPEPATPAEPEPAPEPEVEPAPAEPEAPADPTPDPEPAPDDWAADVAHLTTAPADDWAADLSHLVDPDSSSSAATSA
ncbi:head maturation protease, ClpP-related [Streptomyces sp. NPDC005496]|uniref:head maturation protease, ClpP-related n=1 Tax=unclassified Streptomyces TaxID=2593676 RepID=UPI0033A88F48